MGNSLKGDSYRLIAVGGIEAAHFLNISNIVAVTAYPHPGEARHA